LDTPCWELSPRLLPSSRLATRVSDQLHGLCSTSISIQRGPSRETRVAMRDLEKVRPALGQRDRSASIERASRP
jgi:hypothetical protein